VKLNGAEVAITGATGFLGGHLVAACQARGVRVVAVVRNPQKAAPLAARGVVIRSADLADRAALARAFEGVQAVIHNAGVVSFTEPAATMRTNAEGTRSVFEAMAECGVRRAVLISSATAYPSSYRTLDETSPSRRGDPDALLHAYGESKARAEQIASALSARHGIGLTTLRPCGITGPSDPLLIPALRAFTRFPVSVLPAFTTIGVVHARDVADAACSALEREHAAGKVYNLQGHTISLWQLARRWAALSARRPRLFIPVPVPLSLRFDDTRARTELGFSPRSVEAIFAEAQAAEA
jgi:nucleoside-diphosphate-sugar epimerase